MSDYEVELINGQSEELKDKDKEVDACLFEAARQEEMKKPEWLRSPGFMIACKCKRCRRYMGAL